MQNPKGLEAGERVILHDQPGTIVDCFVDGIAWVRMDNGKTVAALLNELERAKAKPPPAADPGPDVETV